MNLETITFENNTLKIINQQALPQEFSYLTLTNLDEVIEAIVGLRVRGAPAIGIVAAYGFYKHVESLAETDQLRRELVEAAADRLIQCRPTAVNLAWAVNGMLEKYRSLQGENKTRLLAGLKAMAELIHAGDKETCAAIGKYGAELIKDGANILTHCNAGILATGGSGTALSVVYHAFNSGKKVHVFVDETRPVGQGARLTYWELDYNKVPATLITDNMAGHLMQQNKIDAVIVGADRIARNGDVANKIGTYSLAVLADYHRIPFYVAAPLSTFDVQTGSGAQITIEQRNKAEILKFWNVNGKENYQVYNPAFDITPNHLITAIVSEKGVMEKPDSTKIQHLIQTNF